MRKWLVLALALALCGCATVTPSVTWTPTLTATWTPTLTPTVTPTPTRTAIPPLPTGTPTVTPTLTATWTPTPTATWTPTSTPVPVVVVTTVVSVGWSEEYVVVSGDPEAWRLSVDQEMQAADGRVLGRQRNLSDCRPSVDRPGAGPCDWLGASWVVPEAEAEGCRLWVCLTWTDGVEEVVRCRFQER